MDGRRNGGLYLETPKRNIGKCAIIRDGVHQIFTELLRVSDCLRHVRNDMPGITATRQHIQRLKSEKIPVITNDNYLTRSGRILVEERIFS